MTGEDALILANQFTKETALGGGAIKGNDGFSPIVSTSQITGGHEVTITDANGTHTFDVLDGQNGKDGQNGQNGKDGDKGDKGDTGVSIVSVDKTATAGLVDTYTITFSDGSFTTFQVNNGSGVEKTSQLTNDSGFITNAVNNLINYYLKSDVYTKEEITDLLANISAGLSVLIVDELPTDDISATTIYLIQSGTSSSYQQYMYISGAWASLGDTTINLDNYYTKAQTDAKLSGYVLLETLQTTLADYVKSEDLADVATSGDYNDLKNLPEIPDMEGYQTTAQADLKYQAKEEGKGLSENDLTDELKTAYDGAVNDSHTHSNKAVLDKFAENSSGKPTYDGQEIGGGGGTADVPIESISVNGTQATPDANKNVNITVPDVPIETIAVDGVDQTPTNNRVNIPIVDKIKAFFTNWSFLQKIGESNGKFTYDGTTYGDGTGTQSISKPNTWAKNTEINFGDGLYGYRKTGTITASASKEEKTQIISSASSYKIFAKGGYFDFGNGGKSSIGDYAEDIYSSIRISSSGIFQLYSFSSIARASSPYDVWVLYTKS